MRGSHGWIARGVCLSAALGCAGACTGARWGTPTSAPLVSPWAPPGAPLAQTVSRCVIEASAVRWQGGLVLRAPSGAVFGTLDDATDARFTTAPVETLEATAFGVRLHLAPRSSELPLYTTRPLLFGGLVRVGAATPLDWSPGQHGPALFVTLPRDARVEWLGAPPMALAACTELSLGPYAPPRVVWPAPGGTVRSLDLTKDVPIATAPGGRAIARLSATSPVQDVAVLREEGDFARIDWPLSDGALGGAHVLGWVPRALLGEPRRGKRRRSWGCPSGYSNHAGEPASCAHDRALHVQTQAGFEPVGTLLAGTRIAVTSQMAGWVAVEVLGPQRYEAQSPFSLEKGATFVLRATDAADCR